MESLPPSRAAARLAGVPRYFTGRPCSNGHVAPRAVASGSCVECIKLHKVKPSREAQAAYMREYRARGTRTKDRRKRDVAAMRTRVLKQYKGRVRLVEPLPACGSPITCVCIVHGQFVAWPGNLLRGKGCPQCAFSTRRGTTEQFVARAELVHGQRWDYTAVVYERAVKKVRIGCPQHGEFLQTPNKHLAGQGCPKCGRADPFWERELAAYLERLGYTPQRNAPIFGRQHADLYLPEQKFAIELHGLYWHVESRRGRTYHWGKWYEAERRGVRLVQIFEDEWRDRRAIVEQRLAAMLGKAPTYSARQCTVLALPAATARQFLDRAHLQGAGAATQYYGLRLGADIVAVASFAPLRGGTMTRVDAPDYWEVVRYASVGRVRGGFSRLFTHFCRDFAPECVVSYCDLRYGDGRLYRACGFELDSITEPDYWWVPPNEKRRVPRYQTQKHKLAQHPVLGAYHDPAKSEAEICQAAGWHRLYGVGHQKWIWRNT